MERAKYKGKEKMGIKETADNTVRPWSNLPRELLSIIAAKCINRNPTDILTFRSVCTWWRSSSSPPSRPYSLELGLPLLTPTKDPSLYDVTDFPFQLLANPVLSVTLVFSVRRPVSASALSQDAFLLFVDEFEPGKLTIRCPFARFSCFNQLWPVSFYECKGCQISRFYSLGYRRLLNRKKPSPYGLLDVRKVVLCPNELNVVLVLFNDGELGFISLDADAYERCDPWFGVDFGDGFWFDDIIDYKGSVLALDCGGRVYEINNSTAIVRPVSIVGDCGRRKRLVESLGMLYLVVRCSFNFKVFELSMDRRKWVEVQSIGDRVFVFGVDFSFSASGEQVSCGTNCILYKHHSFRSHGTEKYYPVDDKEVFGHLDKTGFWIGVCHLDDAAYVGEIASYAGYSGTFSPPPSWLWPISRLERLKKVMEKIHYIDRKFSHIFKKQDWESKQRLGKTITEFKEKEQKIMIWERVLQDGSVVNGDSALVDTLNQRDESLAGVRTSGLGTDETDNCPDKMTSAMKHLTNVNSLLANEVKAMYVQQNRMIFWMEEHVSTMLHHFSSIKNSHGA